jgi:hypothetical protein
MNEAENEESFMPWPIPIGDLPEATAIETDDVLLLESPTKGTRRMLAANMLPRPFVTEQTADVAIDSDNDTEVLSILLPPAPLPAFLAIGVTLHNITGSGNKTLSVKLKADGVDKDMRSVSFVGALDTFAFRVIQPGDAGGESTWTVTLRTDSGGVTLEGSERSSSMEIVSFPASV